MDFVFNDEQKKAILRFVRETIAARFGRPLRPGLDGMGGMMNRTGACFVTLETGPEHRLRGCIGNIAAMEPLIKNLERNALNAAFHDPRFPPLEEHELDEIEIDVSVLTPMTPIASPDDFIVGEHGIVLEYLGRHAVFLPQVAPEQGWNREQTLSHLSAKAGLPSDAWRRPGAKFQVFTAIVFGEKDYR